MDRQQRIAFPGRFRFALRDDVAAGATTLDLPARRIWPVGLIVGAMFAVFAGVEWTAITGLSAGPVRGVTDLMFFLFRTFWVVGWSVGVLMLGTLTVLLFAYGESARLQNGKLVYVPHLGPLKIILDYDLARVRNVRLENADSDDNVRIRFDYDQGSNTLGDTMPRADAELLMRQIHGATADVTATDPPSAPAVKIPPVKPVAAAPLAHEQAPPKLASPSGLALIAANLVPLAGVLFFHWNLANVILLFWAESAIIGFYTVLKIAVIGKLMALLAAPFFLAHFGGFMAMHFLFIYGFFIRGLHATGPEPPVCAALLGIFVPLWPSLAALFISHGVSFFTNFLGKREYLDTSMTEVMAAPYNRIIVMQFAIIFGGWIIMLLGSPAGALVLLVLLKTVLDFGAHRKEHS
jgi:uncharacterized protein DUF6498